MGQRRLATMEEERKNKGLSRRGFLKGLGGGAIGTAVISTGLLNVEPAEAYTPEAVGTGRGKSLVNLKVNGRNYRVEVEHRSTLGEVLRDELGLTGTKIGCDRGECGACTVIINGRNVYSCSQLAVWMEGKTFSQSRGWQKATSSTPCRKHSSNMTGRSAAFALRGRSCREKRYCSEIPNP